MAAQTWRDRGTREPDLLLSYTVCAGTPRTPRERTPTGYQIVTWAVCLLVVGGVLWVLGRIWL